jgi:hypothetical protein
MQLFDFSGGSYFNNSADGRVSPVNLFGVFIIKVGGVGDQNFRAFDEIDEFLLVRFVLKS